MIVSNDASFRMKNFKCSIDYKHNEKVKQLCKIF